jgi:hypothetical protein
MQDIARKNLNYKLELSAICLLILFFLFRTAIPFFKYPFVLILFGVIIYSIIKFKKRILSKLKDFIKDYWLLLLLGVILIIGFFISNKLYLTVFKDIINTLLLLFILLILTLFINTKPELDFFLKLLINLIVIFAFVVSVNLLGNSFNIFSNANAFSTTVITDKTISENLKIDNNFALLPVFFGMIGIIYMLLSPISIKRKIIFNLLLILNSLCIFFSGSRRGLLLFLGIITLLVIIQISSFLVKNQFIKFLRNATLFFVLSLIVITGLFYCFTFQTKYLFKTKTIELIGSKNPEATKQRIAFAIHKYLSVVNLNNSYDDFYNILWSASLNISDRNSSFDPKNPESIWGSRIHRTIFPLTGNNLEIVPEGSKGYLMDSTCNADTWSDNAYSYTLIGKKNVNDNDIVKASVYCYVSEDFNGTWAILYSSEGAIGQCDYDLKNKGKWQKLNINLACKKGTEYVHLYFSKFGARDFSSLKGYVIFAYPTVEIISVKTQNSSSLNFNLNRRDRSDSILKKNTIKTYKNNSFLGSINLTDNSTYNISSCFNILPILYNINTDPAISENDPIRKWAARFISEDTTYHDHKKELIVDTVANNFFGPRLMRLKFAVQIFTKEYNWRQRVLGGGFNFLNWYGWYFYKDKTRSDYPHNPFLSVLLYSGIIGFILYLIFISRVFFHYLNYYKEYKIISLFFLITFLFSFFSAGSPFDPPVMGFFVMLPFFIHSVHKKKKPELFDDNVR